MKRDLINDRVSAKGRYYRWCDLCEQRLGSWDLEEEVCFKAVSWSFWLDCRLPARGDTVDVELRLGLTIEGLEW